MIGHRDICGIVLLLLLLFVPHLAQAQANDRAATHADAAFDAYTNGRWAEAVTLFELAIEHDPHPVLLFNHARALEEAQRLPSALAAYRQLEQNNEVPRVAEAASTRRQIVEATLREQGYNPLSVTDATYRIPVEIQILTSVANAVVYVDGRAAGRGASVLARLPAGEHHVYVDAEGYYPFQETMIVPDHGGTLEIELEERGSLAAYVAPPPGLLSVIGPTSGMTIYVDGMQHARTTPANEIVLAEGEYDVVVRHPLYDDFDARVRVEAGEEFRLIATNRYMGTTPEPLLTRRQRAGNGTIAAGSVILASAAFTGTMAAVRARAYNRDPADRDRAATRSSAQRYATSTDVLLVAGAATLGAGLTLRFIAPKQKEEESHYKDRMLEISPGGSGSPLGLTVRYQR